MAELVVGSDRARRVAPPAKAPRDKDGSQTNNIDANNRSASPAVSQIDQTGAGAYYKHYHYKCSY